MSEVSTIIKVLDATDSALSIVATETYGEGMLSTRLSVIASTPNDLLNDLDSNDIIQITL